METVVCPICWGKGKKEFGEYSKYFKECDACNGTGNIKVERGERK